MINKILTVKIQEKDPVTKENHDLFEVKKSNKSNSIVLQAKNNGPVVVEKQDLYDAIKEVELFYGDKLSLNLNVDTTSNLPVLDHPKVLENPSLGFSPLNKELEQAEQIAYMEITQGDDE
jgi:hypothetical protein